MTIGKQLSRKLMAFPDTLAKMPYAVLIALCAVISITTLGSDFLSIDDVELIVNNPNLHFSLSNLLSIFTKPLGQIFETVDNVKYIYYRPALNLLYMFNISVWGVNPVGFHISNLLLHLLTAIILYKCGLMMFHGDRTSSLLAAAIFTVHPVHNELIGRVAMNENLLGFFMAATFFFYLKQSKWLSLIFFTLAMISKESAVMIPFLILIFELSEKPLRTALRSLFPFFVVILIYLAIRLIVVGLPEYTGLGMSLFESVLSSTIALAEYLRLLVFPYPIQPYYSAWVFSSLLQPDIILSASVYLLVICFAWRYRTDKIIVSLLLGLFVLLVPVVLKANQLILGLDRAFIAERQLYAPVFFFSLLLAALLHEKRQQEERVLISFLTIIVISVFAYINLINTSVWSSTENIDSYFILNHPSINNSHRVNGGRLFGRGELDAAMAEYQAALPLRTANRNKNEKLKTKFESLGNLLEKYDIAAYQSAYASIHANIGNIYLAKNDADKALKKFKVAITLNPELTNARIMLARIYMQKKMYKDASREYKIALKDIERYRVKD